jgi:hypothetical protein
VLGLETTLKLVAVGLEFLAKGLELAATCGICVALSTGQLGLG